MRNFLDAIYKMYFGLRDEQEKLIAQNIFPAEPDPAFAIHQRECERIASEIHRIDLLINTYLNEGERPAFLRKIMD